LPSASALLVKTTCLNGDPPLTRLRRSGEGVAFELQWVRCGGALSPPADANAATAPAAWAAQRLLGHLNLNHLSLGA
jgi:hypothetical protein